MRIPVYRSEIAATSEAPGRSIGARMRGSVLAQAELQKGEVLGEVLGQVGAYAKMRYKVAEETKLNEGLLAATEGLNMAARDFARSDQPYNVLDGESPLWNEESQSIREKVLEALGPNRFTRRAFEERFGQMELDARFKLRGVLDKKIDAANQAALASRQSGVVQLLSDPDATREDYDNALTGVAIDQGRLVKTGAANADVVKLSNLKMKTDIAENVVSSYVGADPIRVLNLIGALEQIDAGELDPDKTGDLPNGGYPLYTLQNLPRDDAVAVLDNALKVATRFANAEEKLQKKLEDDRNFFIGQAANRFTYFAAGFEPNETVRASEITDYIPYLKDKFPDPDAVVFASAAAEAMKEFLYTNNAVTPTVQANFDKYEDELTTSRFATTSSEIAYETLFVKKDLGELTATEVQENRALLTRADFKFFLDAVATEEDAALVDAKRIAKATFQYDELSAGDPDAGRASKAAYYAVVQELETMVAERRFTPDARMTPQEINAAAKELIAGQQEAFILGLRLDYEAYVEDVNQDLSGVGLVLDPADPIASLDAWWSNPDTDQTAQQRNYGRIKSTLMREYINKGVLN
jgi:hypothetical protein